MKWGLSGSLVALVLACSCSRAEELPCPSGDLLRCRAEQSRDEAAKRAIAPFLDASDAAAPLNHN